MHSAYYSCPAIPRGRRRYRFGRRANVCIYILYTSEPYRIRIIIIVINHRARTYTLGRHNGTDAARRTHLLSLAHAYYVYILVCVCVYEDRRTYVEYGRLIPSVTSFQSDFLNISNYVFPPRPRRGSPTHVTLRYNKRCNV